MPYLHKRIVKAAEHTARKYSYIILSYMLILHLAGCNMNSENVSEIHHPARAGEKPLQGTLRISCSYAALPVLQSCVSAFHLKNPEVTIILVPRGSENAMDDLHRRNADLAVVSFRNRPAPDQGLSLAFARTGVVIIYNDQNPYSGLIRERGVTISALQKIFSAGAISFWNEIFQTRDSTELHPYTRIDMAGSTDVLAGFLYLDRDNIIGIPVEGEEEMVRMIREDSIGLGYCNIINAFEPGSGILKPNLAVLPIDLNQDGILDDREKVCEGLYNPPEKPCLRTYPYMLTRNLYLVTEQLPGNDLLVSFTNFLIDDGWRIADSLGYYPLSPQAREFELFQLKKALN